MGWVVNATPQPLYPRARNPVPIVWKPVWTRRSVWKGAENLASPPLRDSIPGPSTLSESLYRLSYSGPTIKKITEWTDIAFSRRGRHKMKWEDDVKQDLKVKQFYQWKEQAKSRDECKRITEQAKTHKQLGADRRRIRIRSMGSWADTTTGTYHIKCKTSLLLPKTIPISHGHPGRATVTALTELPRLQANLTTKRVIYSSIRYRPVIHGSLPQLHMEGSCEYIK